jgi:hypothetical protein
VENRRLWTTPIDGFRLGGTPSGRSTMSDIYPIGLPSNNDPFSEDDLLSEEMLTELDRRTDADFVGDDDVVVEVDDEDERDRE